MYVIMTWFGVASWLLNTTWHPWTLVSYKRNSQSLFCAYRLLAPCS